jgi:protein-tyrosine phosphatase
MSVEGALNFREVVGLPAEGGRRIAAGRLYRSDTLQFLTRDDVTWLVRDVGLRSVIDLRLDYELQVEGFGLPGSSDVAHHHLPFRVDGTQGTGDATPILQAADPMVPHYLGYLRTMPESVTGVIRILGDPERVPVLIHCAAGKDRTGVAVAVALSVAGVSHEDIAQEYGRNPDRVPLVMERLRSMESYGDSIDRLPPEAHLTDPEFMRRFLAAVDEMYGGVVGYLQRHGVTDDELQRVRDALTEPA